MKTLRFRHCIFMFHIAKWQFQENIQREKIILIVSHFDTRKTYQIQGENSYTLDEQESFSSAHSQFIQCSIQLHVEAPTFQKYFCLKSLLLFRPFTSSGEQGKTYLHGTKTVVVLEVAPILSFIEFCIAFCKLFHKLFTLRICSSI